jgi:hypothetical protein
MLQVKIASLKFLIRSVIGFVKTVCDNPPEYIEFNHDAEKRMGQRMHNVTMAFF